MKLWEIKYLRTVAPILARVDTKPSPAADQVMKSTFELGFNEAMVEAAERISDRFPEAALELLRMNDREYLQ